MNLSEYFLVIGCRLIIACYVAHYVRGLFLKDPITPQKGAPICLNHIIYGRRLDKITQVMSYTNLLILELNYHFFQQRQMQRGWNKNMAAHFNPSWVRVPDKSIQERINHYACPVWMFAPLKSHSFGNKYHTIVCAKYKVIYIVEILGGKD